MMFDRYLAQGRFRVFVLVLLLGVLVLPTAFSQEKANYDNPTRTSRISSQLYMSHMEFLASDELNGRSTGSEELNIAADYIADHFKTIGLEPIGEGGYFQNFEYARRRRQAVEGEEQPPGPIIKNVVGVLPGAGPNKAEYIVIGGHYDHIGPRSSGDDRILNGADDNASGTAAFIEVARMLASGKPLNRSVLFIGFTAEESGLVGSGHYGNNPLVPNEQTVAMINMDMIGRLHQNKLQLHNIYSGKEFAPLLDELNKFYQFDFVQGSTTRSDHASFIRKGIPSLFLFTGTHPQYHQVGDHLDLINVGGAVNVAQLAADIIYGVSSWKEGPTFQEGTGGVPGGLHSQPLEGQLSTRPDGLRIPRGVSMQIAVKGSLTTQRGGRGAARARGQRGAGGGNATPPPPAVTVESVVEGSPSAEAGMKAGDGLVSIGATQIRNVKALVDALATYNPGDSDTVVVSRDGEQIELKVQFGR